MPESAGVVEKVLPPQSGSVVQSWTKVVETLPEKDLFR